MSIIRKPTFLLPAEGTDLYKWSVIACDQFTSQPEYWEEVEKVVGDAPSTLSMIYPEAYLGEGAGRTRKIHDSMRRFLDSGEYRAYSCYVLVDRLCGEGKHRLGLMCEVDLEEYDYSPESVSAVRATEKTVVERLPVRIEIRSGAPLELPHIMLLTDNRDNFMRELYMLRSDVLYDTPLNMDGGAVTGYRLDCTEKIDNYLNDLSRAAGKGNIVFAVGDGNHSLATAKACWENIKSTLSEEERLTHPARYALCELVSLQDPALEFQPIHRVVFDKDGDFVRYASARLHGNGSCVMVSEGVRYNVAVNDDPAQAIADIQDVIDGYTADRRDCSVDYVHGSVEAESVAARSGGTAILMPLITKNSLFACVQSRGTLPRKSFSMGEGREKRYYMESRLITQEYKISIQDNKSQGVADEN